MWRDCRGAGKLCEEARAADRAKRRALTEAAESKWMTPLREEALVALDAVLEQRDDMRDRLPKLVNAARKLYATTFDVRSGKGNLEPIQLIARGWERGEDRRHFDAYCRYCRVLIEPNMLRATIAQRWGASPCMHPHIVLCSLEMLAGTRAPLGPTQPWRITEPESEAA